MWIRSVNAHAFGPLHNQTLELAEGMTVVIGDNESAKSSWHAAIFAALCGRRRGRGKPRADEQRFIDLHKPWGHGDWLVTAQIRLDDGRDIELRQDLAGKIDCHAKDLVLGRDISAEIINDGAPDAATWLGLDRTTFVATACIEQGQMLRVRDHADGLQDYLQRAAATAGAASTANTALDRIDAYAREHVGLDRANTTRPLRAAKDALAARQHDYEQRTRAHDAYLSRVEEVERLHGEAAAAAAQVRAHEAAEAAAAAVEAQNRARRAAELHTRYGDTPPPSGADGDALAHQVSAALTQWRSRPAPPGPPERSASRIQQDIDALPAPPHGDTQEHPSVLQAAERWTRAATQLESYPRPHPETDAAPQVDAHDDELLDLARTLQTPVPEVPAELIDRETRARRAAEQTHSRPSVAVIAAGVAVAVTGSALAATVSRPVGVLALIAGIALMLAGAVHRHRGGTAAVTRDLARAEAHVQAAQAHTADQAGRREKAAARCIELGVPADPAALRAIPVARARASALHHEHIRQEELRDALQASAIDLHNALTARGHPPEGSTQEVLRAGVEHYRQACRQRAAQAAQAARRDDLLQQLASTQAVERRVASDEHARAQAAEAVWAAADRCAIVAETAQDAVAALQDWMTRRQSRLADFGTAQQEWAELQALLGGATPADLRRAADDAAARAAELADGVDAELLEAAQQTSSAVNLPALRQAADRASARAHTEEGEVRQMAMNLGSVAEAEEDLARARGELHRVLELKETLELTRTFLEKAQTRVHRDIAPQLAATLRTWLPAVTGGRYTDVLVDPQTLGVQVCGASRRWRRADLLSHGTAEQVYLLLRVALADHLTADHDICPLLLDDVTVHADAVRTDAILDLLLQIAAERQVVIFTQEDQVAAWAHAHLTGPRHAIRDLDPVALD